MALDTNSAERHKGFHSLNAFSDVPGEIWGCERVEAEGTSLTAQAEITHFLVLS